MKTFQALAKSQCKIDFWATLKIQWGTQFNFLDNFDIKYSRAERQTLVNDTEGIHSESLTQSL